MSAPTFQPVCCSYFSWRSARWRCQLGQVCGGANCVADLPTSGWRQQLQNTGCGTRHTYYRHGVLPTNAYASRQVYIVGCLLWRPKRLAMCTPASCKCCFFVQLDTFVLRRRTSKRLLSQNGHDCLLSHLDIGIVPHRRILKGNSSGVSSCSVLPRCALSAIRKTQGSLMKTSRRERALSHTLSRNRPPVTGYHCWQNHSKSDILQNPCDGGGW